MFVNTHVQHRASAHAVVPGVGESGFGVPPCSDPLPSSAAALGACASLSKLQVARRCINFGAPSDFPKAPSGTLKVAAGSRLPSANQRVPSSAWESSLRHQPLAGHGLPVVT